MDLHRMVDYEAALREYNRSVGIHPDDPVALRERGATLYRLGRYEEALKDYNRSLELRPDDAETLSNRGVALHKLSRYEEALLDYNRALELLPNAPSTLCNRGVVLHGLGRYQEALEDYNRALELQGDDPSMLSNRGLTLHSLGRYQEALDDYNHSLALQPDDMDLLSNRGLTLYSLGRYKEALDDYNRSLALRSQAEETEEIEELAGPLEPEVEEAEEDEAASAPSDNGTPAGKLCNWCHQIVELDKGDTATDGICTACVLKLVQRSFISGTPDYEGSDGDSSEEYEEYDLADAPAYTQPMAQGSLPAAQSVVAEAPLDAEAEGHQDPVESPPPLPEKPPEDRESPEEHSEIQWLLLNLGNDLGFDVRLAEHGRVPDDRIPRTFDLPEMQPDLPFQLDEPALKAIDAIDVLWMKGKRIIAAFEIASSAGIYPSLLKLSDLMTVWPHLDVQVYLVAPEGCYDQVVAEMTRPTFNLLSPPMGQLSRFIPSADLRELVSRLGQYVRYLKPEFLEQLTRTCEAAES